MRESRKLEFKENVTKTFLKTVCAFANYDGGTILFGVDDDGEVVGIPNVKEACLNIENMINDSITPQPDYIIDLQNNNRTIKLSVKNGYHKPYLYKSKAYKRNDSATIEVDTLEFARLVLEGKNIRFEELSSQNQELSFNLLEQKLEEHIQIEQFNLDTLRTLNLYNSTMGFNNAAALLADMNTFPGVDIIKFGENINVIQKRVTFKNCSVLEQYERAVDLYRDYYQYEEIDGFERVKKESIPEAAFREVLANALIHRVWDVNANIKISMYDDRIEVVSPGGLPPGISKKDYLSGKISVLRNATVANVFYRLGIAEIFGTGVLRIKQIYEESTRKPIFEISENTIQVVLPVYEERLDLTEDERQVYKVLSKNESKPMSILSAEVPFGKNKITSLLKNMESKGLIIIEGRGTKYRLE